jgi:hypothetical protein
MELNGKVLYMNKGEIENLLSYLYSKEKYRRQFFYGNNYIFFDMIGGYNQTYINYEKICFEYINYIGLKKEYMDYKGKIDKVIIVGSNDCKIPGNY